MRQSLLDRKANKDDYNRAQALKMFTDWKGRGDSRFDKQLQAIEIRLTIDHGMEAQILILPRVTGKGPTKDVMLYWGLEARLHSHVASRHSIQESQLCKALSTVPGTKVLGVFMIKSYKSSSSSSSSL